MSLDKVAYFIIGIFLVFWAIVCAWNSEWAVKIRWNRWCRTPEGREFMSRVNSWKKGQI